MGLYAGKHEVAVHAYCLMSNHVHLEVTLHRAESLGRMLKPVHLRYAQRSSPEEDINMGSVPLFPTRTWWSRRTGRSLWVEC